MKTCRPSRRRAMRHYLEMTAKGATYAGGDVTFKTGFGGDAWSQLFLTANGGRGYRGGNGGDGGSIQVRTLKEAVQGVDPPLTHITAVADGGAGGSARPVTTLAQQSLPDGGKGGKAGAIALTRTDLDTVSAQGGTGGAGRPAVYLHRQIIRMR